MARTSDNEACVVHEVGDDEDDGDEVDMFAVDMASMNTLLLPGSQQQDTGSEEMMMMMVVVMQRGVPSVMKGQDHCLSMATAVNQKACDSVVVGQQTMLGQ